MSLENYFSLLSPENYFSLLSRDYYFYLSPENYFFLKIHQYYYSPCISLSMVRICLYSCISCLPFNISTCFASKTICQSDGTRRILMSCLVRVSLQIITQMIYFFIYFLYQFNVYIYQHPRYQHTAALTHRPD